MKKIILLVFFVLSVVVIKSQNYSFTQSTYTANGFPTNVLKGDFNNDGKIDVVMQNQDGINCYLQSSNNTFSTVVTTYTSSLQIYNCSDFNGDGKTDILANSNHLFLGNGNGSFSLTTINQNFSSYATSSSDFNNDGINDIANINTSANALLSVFIGQGNGNFNGVANYTLTGATSIYPGNSSNLKVSRIATKDLNNDNNQDLVISTVVATGTINTGYLSVYLGIGNGTFNAVNTYTYNFDITTIKISDMNMDGNNDLVFSSLNNVYVLQGNGLGGFSSYYNHAILSTSIDIGDVNNDGKLDIVNFNGKPGFACSSTNTVSIIDNTGFGFSLSAKTFSVNSFYGGYSPIICDDFNSDGKVDLAVNTYSCTATLSICYNTTTTPLTLSVSSVSMCVGSCNTLTAVASGGTGPYTYSWTPGWLSGSSIQICPSSSGIYSVVVTDAMMNSAISSVIATVNSNCQDVWPGDANSDGVSDNLDVLELGLHYTLTGPARSNTSNTWQAYFANNWTGTITNGKNLNHSDCNGDGIINDDDTLAIYNNYGLTHAFKPAQTNTVNPQLSIVPDQPAVVKGTWGTASIYLGDASTNINNINGLAFTLDFDNTLIETNSIYIEYQNSFMDAGQNLHFRKLDFASSKLFTATTHTINNNVSGFGKIATLHYQIKSNLATDQVLNLGISQANQSNASGTIMPLTSGTGTLMAMGTSVGLQELNGGLISMSPNPTNGSLTIHSKTELQKIEVVAITGQVLLSEIPTSVSHTLHLDNFANGIYFVNVYQNDRIVKREKIVLNK